MCASDNIKSRGENRFRPSLPLDEIISFLNKEKKLIEQENIGIINNVEEKRKQFYEEYEIESPTKEHACQLMNLISNNDIMELKQVFKKYNKNYENIISPLVLLLGGKVIKEFYFF